MNEQETLIWIRQYMEWFEIYQKTIEKEAKTIYGLRCSTLLQFMDKINLGLAQKVPHPTFVSVVGVSNHTYNLQPDFCLMDDSNKSFRYGLCREHNKQADNTAYLSEFADNKRGVVV